MKKRKKTVARKKAPRDFWFNAFMRVQYLELARLEEENERLRKQMRS